MPARTPVTAYEYRRNRFLNNKPGCTRPAVPSVRAGTGACPYSGCIRSARLFLFSFLTYNVHELRTYNVHEYLFMVDYMSLINGHSCEKRLHTLVAFNRSACILTACRRCGLARGPAPTVGVFAPPGDFCSPFSHIMFMNYVHIIFMNIFLTCNVHLNSLNS